MKKIKNVCTREEIEQFLKGGKSADKLLLKKIHQLIKSNNELIEAHNGVVVELELITKILEKITGIKKGLMAWQENMPEGDVK